MVRHGLGHAGMVDAGSPQGPERPSAVRVSAQGRTAVRRVKQQLMDRGVSAGSGCAAGGGPARHRVSGALPCGAGAWPDGPPHRERRISPNPATGTCSVRDKRVGHVRNYPHQRSFKLHPAVPAPSVTYDRCAGEPDRDLVATLRILTVGFAVVRDFKPPPQPLQRLSVCTRMARGLMDAPGLADYPGRRILRDH